MLSINNHRVCPPIPKSQMFCWRFYQRTLRATTTFCKCLVLFPLCPTACPALTTQSVCYSGGPAHSTRQQCKSHKFEQLANSSGSSNYQSTTRAQQKQKAPPESTQNLTHKLCNNVRLCSAPAPLTRPKFYSVLFVAITDRDQWIQRILSTLLLITVKAP